LKSAWTLFSRIADPLCRNEQCVVSTWLHLSFSQFVLWIRVNEGIHRGKYHFNLNYSLIEKGNCGDFTFLNSVSNKVIWTKVNQG